MPTIFPFTAIVGQERMLRALILNAVNPRIGGVLIRGERGTAKSTAARALAALLPKVHVVSGCRFGCDPSAAYLVHGMQRTGSQEWLASGELGLLHLSTYRFRLQKTGWWVRSILKKQFNRVSGILNPVFWLQPIADCSTSMKSTCSMIMLWMYCSIPLPWE